MNTKRISDIATDIKALETAQFFLINGWGIFSFKSEVNFEAYRSAARRMDGSANSNAAVNLINKLNDAIKPILQEEIKMLKEELKKETAKE